MSPNPTSLNPTSLNPTSLGSATVNPATLDPSVPGLGPLLDDARLADLLDRVDERLLARHYLRWKPGTSCVAGLELESGPAFALALTATARPKLAKSCVRAPAGSLLLVDRAIGLLVARPAADRHLPALSDLSHTLARVCPDREPRWVQPRAYKPQRRWVGEVLDRDGSRSGARVYRRRQVTDAAARLAAVADAGVGAPALLGVDQRTGLLVQEWAPGEPLDRLAGTGRAPAGVWTELGEALARLHRRRASVGPAAVAAPHASVGLVSRLLPGAAGRLGLLLRRWQLAAPSHQDRVLCHGDLSADQVVVGADVRLIDWDRAGHAPPAADLASLWASGLPEDAWSQAIAGYARHRPLPADLAWHQAGALLLRLAEPWRSVLPDWQLRTEELVDRAEAALDRAEVGVA